MDPVWIRYGSGMDPVWIYARIQYRIGPFLEQESAIYRMRGREGIVLFRQGAACVHMCVVCRAFGICRRFSSSGIETGGSSGGGTTEEGVVSNAEGIARCGWGGGERRPHHAVFVNPVDPEAKAGIVRIGCCIATRKVKKKCKKLPFGVGRTFAPQRKSTGGERAISRPLRLVMFQSHHHHP